MPPSESEELNNQRQDQREDQWQVRGENLVLRITSICAIFGTFGLAVWWASQLQADVRGVQRDVATIRQAVGALDKMGTLENEIRELRQYGSENARKNERDIADLKREYDMHKAVFHDGKPIPIKP